MRAYQCGPNTQTGPLAESLSIQEHASGDESLEVRCGNLKSITLGKTAGIVRMDVQNIARAALWLCGEQRRAAFRR